jgi:hypothetical protein
MKIQRYREGENISPHNTVSNYYQSHSILGLEWKGFINDNNGLGIVGYNESYYSIFGNNKGVKYIL